MTFPDWIKTIDDFYNYLKRCAEVATEQGGIYNGIAIQWKACDIPDVIKKIQELIELSNYNSYSAGYDERNSEIDMDD